MFQFSQCKAGMLLRRWMLMLPVVFSCIVIKQEMLFVDISCYPVYFTFQPEQVHDPNFRSHNWSSKGNHVMSILQVLLNIPGGTQRQLPSLDTTTLVWQVPSNFSSALELHRYIYTSHKLGGIMEAFNMKHFKGGREGGRVSFRKHPSFNELTQMGEVVLWSPLT